MATVSSFGNMLNDKLPKKLTGQKPLGSFHETSSTGMSPWMKMGKQGGLADSEDQPKAFLPNLGTHRQSHRLIPAGLDEQYLRRAVQKIAKTTG